MHRIDPYRLKVSQLRALVAIADCGNFSEAALFLELSQSTISHAIAALETELGVVLLKRGRHGANLTPVGERVVVQARRALGVMTDIALEANRERGLQGGQVRIAAFRSVATHLLPTAIAQFRRLFPDISFSIIEEEGTDEIEQALREGRVDIGFTIAPTGSEFELFEVLKDEYVVLLPPDEKLTTLALTWEQLAAYPLILSRTGCCAELTRKHLQRAPVELDVAYEVRRDSTMVSMVVQGLGAAILPRLAADPIPAGVQVCRLPEPLYRHIAAAMLSEGLQGPAAFAFLDALRSTGRFGARAG